MYKRREAKLVILEYITVRPGPFTILELKDNLSFTHTHVTHILHHFVHLGLLEQTRDTTTGGYRKGQPLWVFTKIKY